MAVGGLELRILGSLEASVSSRPATLGAPKQRTLLAVLAVAAGEPVSKDRIAGALWGDSPPASSATIIQGYVSGLRKALGPQAILTEGGGYRLDVAADAVDARRFERLAAEARHATDAHAAYEALRQALALWRGPALVDFRFDDFAQAEAARLEELRLVALEARIAAELELGRAGELIPELRSLIEQHPLREGLRRHLMLAAYRAGRQAEALEAYRDTRQALDELGLEPSPSLQELERAILNQDPALAPPRPAEEAPRPVAPVPVTRIVGRRAELATIRGMLEEPAVRLLTLVGPGGIGKTRLALEVLQELASAYEDGTVFVPLAAVDDGELVLPAVAAVLGIHEVAGKSPRDVLTEWLRERRMLIVLDNFEQVTAAAAVLPSLLAAAPRLQLLVTSRETLRIEGEQELHVPSLDRGDALELLVERGRAASADVDPDDTAATLSEICSRLDDLPLAIELAAARLKVMTPLSMLRRLDERLGLLTGGRRDLPERQQTLRATLDWSHELLDEDEQLLFARMSVFAGGCTLEAAEAVCGRGADVVDRVGSLVDKSLLRARRSEGAEPRLLMLQTIREYAHERLAELGCEDELRTAHARYYAEFVDRAARELTRAEQDLWLDALEADNENLRAALGWLLERGDQDAALVLARGLWKFWQTRGRLTEGAGWLTRALAGDPPPTKATADALNGAGCLATSMGRLDEAVSLLERAVSLYEQLGERRGLGWALNNLGLVYFGRDDVPAARAFHEQSLGIAREIGDDWLVASSLINLGNIAWREADYDRAEALQEEGRVRSHELGDIWREGIACLNLGWVHVQQRDETRADARFRESIGLFRRLRELRHLPDALEGLAAVAAAELPDRAARLFGAAEALRAAIAIPLSESEVELLRQHAGPARERLGSDAYERERDAGRELAPEEAVSYALERHVDPLLTARAPADA